MYDLLYTTKGLKILVSMVVLVIVGFVLFGHTILVILGYLIDLIIYGWPVVLIAAVVVGLIKFAHYKYGNDA